MKVAFTWDWKEQPPLAKILDTATAISGTGPVFHVEPDTGGDFYAVVLSDRPLTDEEIEHAVFNPQ